MPLSRYFKEDERGAAYSPDCVCGCPRTQHATTSLRDWDGWCSKHPFHYYEPQETNT